MNCADIRKERGGWWERKEGVQWRGTSSKQWLMIKANWKEKLNVKYLENNEREKD